MTDESDFLDSVLSGTVTNDEYAKLLLLRNGRSYEIGARKTLILQVYSTSESDVRKLKLALGGNYHPHRSGYQWTVAKRTTLATIYDKVFGTYKGTIPTALKPFVQAFSLASKMHSETTDEDVPQAA